MFTTLHYFMETQPYLDVLHSWSESAMTLICLCCVSERVDNQHHHTLKWLTVHFILKYLAVRSKNSENKQIRWVKWTKTSPARYLFKTPELERNTQFEYQRNRIPESESRTSTRWCSSKCLFTACCLFWTRCLCSEQESVQKWSRDHFQLTSTLMWASQELWIKPQSDETAFGELQKSISHQNTSTAFKTWTLSTDLSVHCSPGKIASGSVTLFLSRGPGVWPVWLTARLAKRTSYSTQLKRNVVNVTTNRNCLRMECKEKLNSGELWHLNQH